MKCKICGYEYSDDKSSCPMCGVPKDSASVDADKDWSTKEIPKPEDGGQQNKDAWTSADASEGYVSAVGNGKTASSEQKFYTIQSGNEEFQKLLDKEFEKIRANQMASAERVPSRTVSGAFVPKTAAPLPEDSYASEPKSSYNIRPSADPNEFDKMIMQNTEDSDDLPKPPKSYVDKEPAAPTSADVSGFDINVIEYSMRQIEQEEELARRESLARQKKLEAMAAARDAYFKFLDENEDVKSRGFGSRRDKQAAPVQKTAPKVEPPKFDSPIRPVEIESVVPKTSAEKQEEKSPAEIMPKASVLSGEEASLDQTADFMPKEQKSQAEDNVPETGASDAVRHANVNAVPFLTFDGEQDAAMPVEKRRIYEEPTEWFDKEAFREAQRQYEKKYFVEEPPQGEKRPYINLDWNTGEDLSMQEMVEDATPIDFGSEAETAELPSLEKARFEVYTKPDIIALKPNEQEEETKAEEMKAPVFEEPKAPLEKEIPPAEDYLQQGLEQAQEPKAPVIEEPEAPAIEEPKAPAIEEPKAPAIEEPKAPVIEEPEAPADEVPKADPLEKIGPAEAKTPSVQEEQPIEDYLQQGLEQAQETIAPAPENPSAPASKETGKAALLEEEAKEKEGLDEQGIIKEDKKDHDDFLEFIERLRRETEGEKQQEAAPIEQSKDDFLESLRSSQEDDPMKVTIQSESLRDKALLSVADDKAETPKPSESMSEAEKSEEDDAEKTEDLEDDEKKPGFFGVLLRFLLVVIIVLAIFQLVVFGLEKFLPDAQFVQNITSVTRAIQDACDQFFGGLLDRIL